MPYPGQGPPRRSRRNTVLLGVSTLGVVLVVALARAIAASSDGASDTTAPTGSMAVAELPAGELPVDPSGTATLDDPTIGTARRQPGSADEWCGVLTAADIAVAAAPLTQDGAPDPAPICRYDLSDGGFFFLSELGITDAGAPIEVAGNSAIITDDGDGQCQVTVALDGTGGVLDVDVRDTDLAPADACRVAHDLAVVAVGKLPAV